MEAASRPSPELLVDLPIEEPLDALAPPRRQPPTLAPAPPAAAPASAARPARDPEQTDLHFMDPELFLPPDDPGALPIAPHAAPVGHADAELELQDPIVDELLTSPPPPPPPRPRHPNPPLVVRPPGSRHPAWRAGQARGPPRRPGPPRTRWHRQPRHRPRHPRYPAEAPPPEPQRPPRRRPPPCNPLR